MWTVIVQTLRESFLRRMGLVLLLISLLIPAALLWFYRFEPQPDGTVSIYVGSRLLGNGVEAAQWTFEVLYQQSSGLWFFLGLFATAPLLTAYLDRGWAEMLFSKGLPRWELLLGRYLGALGLFALALILLDSIPALYLWLRAGVAPGRFFLAMAVLVFSFATVLALMTLVAVVQPTTALPVIAGFVQIIFSALLMNRDILLYDIVRAGWARWCIDWIYRILPKNRELEQFTLAYLRTEKFPSWWPVWSSALFLVGALAVAIWLLRRRNL